MVGNRSERAAGGRCAAACVVTSTTISHLPACSPIAQCSIPLPVSRKRGGSCCRRYRRRHARTQLTFTGDDEFPRNDARVSCTATLLTTVSHASIRAVYSELCANDKYACNRQPVYLATCRFRVHVLVILPNFCLFNANTAADSLSPPKTFHGQYLEKCMQATLVTSNTCHTWTTICCCRE